MKSLFAAGLAAASFAASFAASVETQVEQHAVVPARQIIVEPVQKVLEPVAYNVFGRQLLPLATDKADTLIVISGKKCPPCRRLEKEVLEPLQKEGYNIQVVMSDEYDGKEQYDRTPTLLFYGGDKVVKRMVGYQTKDTITKVLVKPTLEISND